MNDTKFKDIAIICSALQNDDKTMKEISVLLRMLQFQKSCSHLKHPPQARTMWKFDFNISWAKHQLLHIAHSRSTASTIVHIS